MSAKRQWSEFLSSLSFSKSKPSDAGSIWRGRKRQPVDVLPFAAAHDLAVFLLTTQRLLQLRSAAGSVLRTELDRPFARPCGATAKDAEKPHDAHKKRTAPKSCPLIDLLLALAELRSAACGAAALRRSD